MRIKMAAICTLACVFLVGLVLALSSCSGGTENASAPSDFASSEPADTTDADSTPPAEDVEPSAEPEDTIAEDPVTQASDVPPSETPDANGSPTAAFVLSWARDAGGLNHCDRLTITAEGQVEAVVCRAGVSQPPIVSQLTDEQLARVLSWAASYAAFTRREMEISRAVRTTMLEGTGSEAPPIEVKQDIASFCAELYLGLAEAD